MPVVEDLVREIDVDAALEEVLSRHERVVRSRKQARVLLVAACVLVVVGVGWLVWGRDDSNESVDVVGVPEDQATPASITVQQSDGLLITLSIDDDRVAIGDTVEVKVTVSNQGPATLFGDWSGQDGCAAAVGVAVRAMENGQPLSVGNLDHGDNNWFAPRDRILSSVARQTDVQPRRQPDPQEADDAPGAVMSSVLTRPLSLLGHDCAQEPPVEPLGPGEQATMTAEWNVWLGPGALPPDGEFRVDVSAFFDCPECTHLPLAGPENVPTEDAQLALWVDPDSRTAAPAPEQLVAAVERDDVQAVLEQIGPRVIVGSDPEYGGWLLQIDRRWLQRIQGEAGAVDIWFGEAGEVVEVQHKTGEGLVSPPGN